MTIACNGGRDCLTNSAFRVAVKPLFDSMTASVKLPRCQLRAPSGRSEQKKADAQRLCFARPSVNVPHVDFEGLSINSKWLQMAPCTKYWFIFVALAYS